MLINRITEGYFSVEVDPDELSPSSEIQFMCVPQKTNVFTVGVPSEVPPGLCKMRVYMDPQFRSKLVECSKCGCKYFLVIKEKREQLPERWEISEDLIQAHLLMMDVEDLLNIANALKKDRIVADIMEHDSEELLKALEQSEKWKNRFFSLEV